MQVGMARQGEIPGRVEEAGQRWSPFGVDRPRGARRVRAVLVVVAALATAAGCASSGGSTADPGSSGLQTVRIAVLPTQSNLGIYAAIDNGYFKSAGINVQLTQTSNGPADLAAVIGGSADLGFSEILSATAAVENGESLNLVTAVNGGDPVGSSIEKYPSTAPGGNSGALLVSPKSSITTAADLKGKTIGYNGVPLLKTLIEKYLDDNGVNPQSVQYTVISSYAAMGTALAANQVDAVVAIDPFQEEIIGAGQGKILADVSAQEPSASIIAGLWGTPGWLKAHSQLVTAFVAAFRRGAAAANAMTPLQKVTTLSKFGQFTNLAQLQKQIPAIVDDIHYAVQASVPMTTSATGDWSVASANEWISVGVKYGVVPKAANLEQYLWPTATGGS
jgi:NitT/TauT family transport system substrate-binding protein